MSLELYVAAFLEEERGKEFCDVCVSEEVQSKVGILAKLSEVTNAAWTLTELTEFGRSIGKCSLCKQVKVVTRVR